jgi:arylformamidase
MGRLDPDYDNRAAVPRFADFLARWNAASQAARAQAAVSKGGFSQHAYLTQGHFDPSELCDREPSNRERFGPPWGSTRCTIDFFSAAGEGPQPLLVFLHGGYWRSLGPEVFHCIAPAWTSRGTHVAFVGYDLCPSVEIDQIASQCRAAMRWLFAHGDSLGVDLTRVVVSGHSAGGHLAAMLASAPTPEASSRAESASRGFSIAGCISLSGVFDLAPLAQTGMNADLRLREVVIAGASPIYRVPDPALLTKERFALFVGADELQGFHDQHAAVIRAWGLNGKAIAESLPGLHHFSIVDTLTDPGSRVFQVAEKMLGLAHSAAV